ncbi:C39 family peptidase [Serratia marcescens]|uniref:C39 family peptidase n=1 Tax=Serratia marcescens TaxID=615 RepID=UPI000A1919BC|nr:C39 family peptidase [Serratia marcescens]
MRAVPYECQWASPELAADLIAGRATLAQDENWARSGARDRAEYIEWANHVCGMACLKMVLGHRDGETPPLLELARRSLPYGAYVREGERIKGLIYAPFVEYVREQFALQAEVKVGLDAADVPALLSECRYFIASVHPAIRRPESTPPHRGGHLVLITAADAQSVTFHNPSGDSPATRERVCLPLSRFSPFFAGRGIAIA